MSFYEKIFGAEHLKYDKRAITFLNNEGWREYSYRDLDLVISQFEKCLAPFIVGDRVAIVAGNGLEWVAALLAINKIKMVAVLIDKSLDKAEILRQVGHAEVQCVITDLLDWDFGALVIDIKGIAVRHMNERRSYEITRKAAAVIIYSSGTTRQAAGIVHSSDALMDSTLMCARENKLVSEDRFLSVIPNSHIYGLICLVLAPLLLGADVCYVAEANPKLIKTALEEYKPTIFPTVARLYELFYEQILGKVNKKWITRQLMPIMLTICGGIRAACGINLGPYVFKSIHKAFGGHIKILCCAGSPINPKVASFYLSAGFNFLLTYGATETGIPTIGNRGKELSPDSCGYVYDGISVRLAEDGELLIRSSYRMLEYWREPELTEEAFIDDYFKSGDIFRCEDGSKLWCVERKKDTIVLNTGKKISPVDIEAKLSGVPGILELVVCGIKDSRTGADTVHVFIVADGDLNSIKRDIYNVSLGDGVAVAGVHKLDFIPRTTLQKPKRYLLQELQLEEENDRAEETLEGLISEVSGVPSTEVREDSKIFKDFGLDSLGCFILISKIEDTVGIQFPSDIDKDVSVQEIKDIIAGQKRVIRGVDGCLNQYKYRGNYIIFNWVRKIVKGMYNIQYSGLENLPQEGAYILCANHTSNFDYLFLTSYVESKDDFRKLFAISKKEIGQIPIFGQFISRAYNLILTDREGLVADAMKQCNAVLREGNRLVVFPEGTRSKDGKLGAIRNGAGLLAVSQGVPIVPAVIVGAHAIYPSSKKYPKLRNEDGKQFDVIVKFLKPIVTTATESVEELTNLVRNSLQEGMSGCRQ